MLELLVKYARDHLPPTKVGFKPKTVRWLLVFNEHGHFEDVLPLGDASQKKNPGRTFDDSPEFSFAEMKAGGVTKSNFLVDTAAVVTLLDTDPADSKIKAKHEFFTQLLRKASGPMPVLAKAAQSLEDERELRRMRARLQALKVKPNEKVTIRIGDTTPLESNAWHEWWAQSRTRLAGVQVAKRDSGRNMRCFVTGEVVSPVSAFPKVEGLTDVGGISMGTVLVSFDKDAFTSYGLEQSANAAVSSEAAAASRAGLNDLIRNHSQRLAGTRVVHWFKKKVRSEDDPLPWLEEGAETEERNAQHKAKELLQSIADGKRHGLGDNRFYALSLSGSGGRVMVRDWMDGPFEELVANVGCWFEDLSVVHQEGGRPAPDPSFMRVLRSTVRKPKEGDRDRYLPAPFVTKMWRVAVRREPIPQTALAQALARVKVDIIEDQPFNHARMGLMKAYHVRQDRMKGMKNPNMKPYLNEEHPSPAYHCGRLMAVLAKLQQAALGDVGAGVVQRYYAAASATPALVLGRLTRNGQFHLNKLEHGLAHWYEERIGEISGRFKDSIPVTLSLEEQSLFALGYYQQWVELRTKKSEDKK